MSIPTVAPERIRNLREWLRQKLEDHGDGDVFIEDGDNRIIWLSTDDQAEIMVITIQPGKVEVVE